MDEDEKRREERLDLLEDTVRVISHAVLFAIGAVPVIMLGQWVYGFLMGLF